MLINMLREEETGIVFFPFLPLCLENLRATPQKATGTIHKENNKKYGKDQAADVAASEMVQS